MNVTTPPNLADYAFHVDHELSQLIRLHYHMRCWWYPFYPKIIRRACRVAYAAHLRAALEFFHDGRPGWSRMRAQGCENRDDIKYGDYVGTNILPDWTVPELARMCDADKLLGHLSKHRVAREGRPDKWGCDADRDIWLANAATVVRTLGGKYLPKSLKALRKFEPSRIL